MLGLNYRSEKIISLIYIYKCTFDNGVKPVNLVKINDLMYKQNLVTKLYVMQLIMK